MSPLRFFIREPLDVFDVRRATRRLALEANFSRLHAEELVLVTSELASNIVKHAHGGEITIQLLVAPEAAGLAITAIDGGAPITALINPTTNYRPEIPGLRGHGLGEGLASVARLSDSVDYQRTNDENRIVVKRYVSHQRRAT